MREFSDNSGIILSLSSVPYLFYFIPSKLIVDFSCYSGHEKFLFKYSSFSSNPKKGFINIWTNESTDIYTHKISGFKKKFLFCLPKELALPTSSTGFPTENDNNNNNVKRTEIQENILSVVIVRHIKYVCLAY